MVLLRLGHAHIFMPRAVYRTAPLGPPEDPLLAVDEGCHWENAVTNRSDSIEFVKEISSGDIVALAPRPVCLPLTGLFSSRPVMMTGGCGSGLPANLKAMW